MVTAICNVYINSDEKLRLFKETFPSVYEISDNWLIYIRGKYKKEVEKFIQDNFPDKETRMVIFDQLDDSNWSKSTQEMLIQSRYEYIYVFLEDHFLLKSIEHFREVIRNMKDNRIGYFQYSFFNVGLHTRSVEKLYPDFTSHFYSFTLDPARLQEMREEHKYFFPYSLASVSSKQYFLKLLHLEQKTIKVPSLFQALLESTFFRYPKNRLFWFLLNTITAKLGLRLTIYSAATPFNLEKSLFDFNASLMPLTVGVLREELFANWDDDNGVSDSSLIKRGLYPLSFQEESVKYEVSPLKIYALPQGQSLQFQYYPDKSRVTVVPLKYIFVEQGVLQVASASQIIQVSAGEHVWVAANIPHTITAVEESQYGVYIKN